MANSAIAAATDQQRSAYVQTTPKGPRKFVPLRADPFGSASDTYDAQRKELVHGEWNRIYEIRRFYLREIEENVRMLSGQQWSIWNPLLQRFLDVSEWMPTAELKWRMRPVFNRLLPWFMITHARATENSPIITFIPGPDRIDAQLAETLDTAFKVLWRELGMTDVNDRVMAWLVAAGRGHCATRINRQAGPMRPWIGRSRLPQIDPSTGQPAVDQNTGQPVLSDEEYPNVPFGPDGNPRMVLTPDGPMKTGEPHEEPEGKLQVDVYSPLECCASWGPQPWHEKPIHYTRLYLTPEQIWEQYGADVEPEIAGRSSGDVGELERLLFGTGFFNASSGNVAAQQTQGYTEGFIEVTSRWQSPCNYGGLERTKDSPGGRVTVVTKKGIVLYDGVRPAAFNYTSNIRCWDFVRIPGRPAGSTALEAMKGPQRAYNRQYAQISEHVNLCTNPKPIIDGASGIQASQWTNEPGKGFIATRRAGVPAVEWVVPPPLGPDVYKYGQSIREELEFLGQTAGAHGNPPTEDASGELVKELRFNSDRYFGPAMRRAPDEYGRLAEDWIVVLPAIWDEKKVLDYAGDDNVARTITVMPYFFTGGKVRVVADAESMLPEGRGERQARVYKMYMDGLFGLPGSPEARKMYFELARMPHLSRAAKPGGVDRIMADQVNGMLLQGMDAKQIPFFPWYDAGTHLGVLADFMKSPEFLKQTPEIKAAFVYRWQVIQQTVAQAQAQAQAQALDQQRQLSIAQNAGKTPPKGGTPEGGGPPLTQGPPSPPQGMSPDQMPTAAPMASA